MTQKITLPKVLIIDVNAWREDAPSNTLLDIFSCWDPDKLALIYTSSAYPATKVCNRFFQIGESQVLKSVFQPWIRVGRVVPIGSTKSDKDTEKEKELRERAHRSFSKLMRLAREIVWKLGHWKTKNLISFISDFNPDVIFVPIFPYAYMGRIQKYVLKHFRKPYVCYLADDNYSYDSCQSVLDYVQRCWTRKYVEYLARNCNNMFVIVDKEKEDTDNMFGTDSVILTKSVDFSNKVFVPKELNIPLRFVYTGNLLIGRDKSLSLVADVINRINEEVGKTAAELYIYSQTIPKEQTMKHINCKDSHFCGSISHQEVEQKLQDADVVIFAEALSGKQSNIAKLSFSTKITDYLSNGKCILAIGKEYIAPIDYFSKYKSALIASSPNEVYSRIRQIIDYPEIINQYGEKAYNCAFNNHEKEMMNQRFIKTMFNAVELINK